MALVHYMQNESYVEHRYRQNKQTQEMVTSARLPSIIKFILDIVYTIGGNGDARAAHS